MLRELTAQVPDKHAFDMADSALLAYGDKLTLAPWSITRDDVEHLREQGFGDRAIHDICAIVSYFAFVNRIADGLGVELEGESDHGEPAAPR